MIQSNFGGHRFMLITTLAYLYASIKIYSINPIINHKKDPSFSKIHFKHRMIWLRLYSENTPVKWKKKDSVFDA